MVEGEAGGRGSNVGKVIVSEGSGREGQCKTIEIDNTTDGSDEKKGMGRGPDSVCVCVGSRHQGGGGGRGCRH